MESHTGTPPYPQKTTKSEAEDFAFAVELIDELVLDYNLDPERVYASGYSNGGFFSYALACYHGDKIAAVAVASGTMLDGLQDTCTTETPTGVLVLHGTNDYVVPYEGSGEGYDSVGLFTFGLSTMTSTPPQLLSQTVRLTSIDMKMKIHLQRWLTFVWIIVVTTYGSITILKGKAPINTSGHFSQSTP